MIYVDGSFGEGGGQIVRSAVALSVATGQPVTIEHIRAKRAKPGLQPQHLAAVRAAAAICQADVSGATIGSTRICFTPGPIQPGDYTWDIGTAGSSSLVLQTVLLPLLIAPGASRITIVGGTHNPLAPPFEFLQDCFLPVLGQMGAQVTAELLQRGFYPRGGGKVIFHIMGGWKPVSWKLVDRGVLRRRRVTAVVVRLPSHIARRECQKFLQLSGWHTEETAICEVPTGPSPGNYLIAYMDYEHITTVLAAIGQRGVPAEQVAENLWQEVQAYLSHDAPVETHLADQLILPGAWLAATGYGCRFRTGPLSLHGQTHAELVQQFLPVHIDVSEREPGTVVVELRQAHQA